MKLESYRDLQVWQKAHQMTLYIYRVTKSFPSNEQFGLTSQIRRSAVSVAANMAEGCGRKHIKEYIQMLYISQGSLEETKYYLLLAKELDYLSKKVYNELNEEAEEIGRMLRGLTKSLEKKRQLKP